MDRAGTATCRPFYFWPCPGEGFRLAHMNRFFPMLGLAVLAFALSAAPASAKPRAVAHLKGLDGKPVGTVAFPTVNRGVLIEFDLHGLPPGPHGIHLHVSGNCDPKTGFTSAGPILSLGPGDTQAWLSGRRRAGGGRPAQPVRRRRRTAACRDRDQRLRPGQRQALDLRPRWRGHHRGPARATIIAPSRWAMPATASPAAWSMRTAGPLAAAASSGRAATDEIRS